MNVEDTGYAKLTTIRKLLCQKNPYNTSNADINDPA